MARTPISLSFAIAFAIFPLASHASCGSAFCTLMTDRYAQGTGEPHVGWSADFRLEAVTQDRLRSGTHSLSPADVTGEDSIERVTRNLNFVTTLGYGFDEHWSVSVRAPVVRRFHSHDLLDPAGGPSTLEQWRFTRAGDVQVTARRQQLLDDTATSWAWFAGLKLPTGSTNVVNADGSRAERALQPGTGTTDATAGLAARHAAGLFDAVFGQVSVMAALGSHEDFRPGNRVEAAAGWSHAFSNTWGSVLQLNVRHRKRDTGAQAEPGNSGSTIVDLSPGFTHAVGESSTLYAYLQVPIYQKVTGVQLVPRRALAVGWTMDF